MKNKPTLLFSLLVLMLCIGLGSCEKDHVNPYDQFEDPTIEDSLVVQLNPISIEGLHTNIFKPTCANSGCHDGTFEPDFRTINSSYNTLVLQPIIKNDPQGSFSVRVQPSSPDESVLMARLSVDIDNSSGIMPLALEPDSDWPSNVETYKQNVRDWIQSGAKDVFGNSPGVINQSPQMQGAMARTGGQWLDRSGNGQSSILINQAISSIDLYLAFSDDVTTPQNLTENTIRFSSEKNNFESSDVLNLQIQGSPEQQIGYFGDNQNYYHKITINPQDYASVGETIYFRAKIKDADNPIVEIPSNAGADYIKNYFSFTIIE